MRHALSLLCLAACTLGCQTVTPSTPGLASGAPVSVFPPDLAGPAGAPASQEAVGPFVIDASAVPTAAEAPNRPENAFRPTERHPEMPISEEEWQRLQAEALLLPPSSRVQSPEGPGGFPVLGGGFESLSFDDHPSSTPPDPELAVGPSHIIAVVNSSLEIHDKTGTTLLGPVTMGSFFSGVPSCTGLFDPNALYDEEEDRFFVGIDSGGSGYCFAVSQTGDPTGLWNGYRFGTGGLFFDFPHAGVGDEAIFMGANLFSGGFVRSDVWAIDKAAAYAGSSLPTPVVQTIGGDTPQPMHLQGFAQGTWPAPGSPHYLMVDTSFNGTSYGVWSWTDPFGANTLSSVGTVDLNTFTGVTAGAPLNFPQMGSAAVMQGNDWRVQDAEFRNGSIWMAHTMACNPGGGTVNCVRWAEIDPSTATVVQAGVLGSTGDYRQFPNVAVNHSEDMIIGFTKSNTSIFPSVHVAARLGSDPANSLSGEVEAKAGEVAYTGFDGSPHRWGDYSEAAADPDGSTLWYIGEYSEDTATSTNWGNYIVRVTFGSIFTDGFESGDVTAWTASVP